MSSIALFCFICLLLLPHFHSCQSLHVAIDVSLSPSPSDSRPSLNASADSIGFVSNGGERVTPIAKASYRPSVGTVVCLGVYVQFDGDTPIRTPQQYEDYLFHSSDSRPFTLSSYYREVSYGLLNIDEHRSRVVGAGPKNGPWHSAIPTHKRQEDFMTEYDPYGFSALTHWILEYLDREWNGDFSAFANPRTKEIECFLPFGTGPNQPDASHPRTLSSLQNEVDVPKTKRGYSVKRVQIGHEYSEDAGLQSDRSEIVPMGPFIHEFGHGMGLMDLYSFTGVGSAVGAFDLMCAGCYGMSQFGRKIPTHLSAHSKMELNWLQPTEVKAWKTPQTYKLYPVETHPDAIKIPISLGYSNVEYFLLENRQQIGFDVSLNPSTGDSDCNGILVWRVDDATASMYTNSIVYWDNLLNTMPDPSLGANAVSFNGVQCQKKHNCNNHGGLSLVSAMGDTNEWITNKNYEFSGGRCEDMLRPSKTSSLPWQSLVDWRGHYSGISITATEKCSDGAIMVQIGGYLDKPQSDSTPEYHCDCNTQTCHSLGNSHFSSSYDNWGEFLAFKGQLSDLQGDPRIVD